MKADLSTVLKDKDGKARKMVDAKLDERGMPVKEGQGFALESKGDQTLKDVLYLSVNAAYKDEALKPTYILFRGKLARRINHGGERSFSNDDVKLILELVSKRYQGDPELVLQITEILDPDNKELKDMEPAESKPEPISPADAKAVAAAVGVS